MVLLLIKNLLDAHESHPIVTDPGCRYAQIRSILEDARGFVIVLIFDLFDDENQNFLLTSVC